MKARQHLALLASVMGLAGHVGGALAGAPATTMVESSADPARDTLNRMMRPVTGEFRGQRLEDAIRYIAEVTGADIEPLWTDEANVAGLDRERTITLAFRGISALQLMERVLEKASDASPGAGCTWQFSEGGALQVGPRARLNQHKRVEMYDVHDLLRETPNYLNAPQLDLQSALQSNAAGGGGGSVFRETGVNAPNSGPGGVETQTLDQRGARLRTLLVDLVEPDQWQDHGGDGGSIVYYQGVLIVSAPDYLQRQIGGRSFRAQRSSGSENIGAGPR